MATRTNARPTRFGGRSRAGLAATAGVALVLGLTGCGANDGTSGDDASGSAASTTNDTLTIAEQNPPNNMNPALADQNADFIVPAYDSLTYETADGVIEPGLAESWKYVGEGNMVFELTLRTDAVFTDGSPVNGAAVKASLEYARDAGGNNASILAGAQITAPNDTTVSIALAAPNPMMPTLLSQGWGVGDIISPTGLADPDSLTTDAPSQGAGQYVYDPEQSVANDHYTYTANPDYYDPSRQHYKTIVIKVVSDQQTAVNAASTGELDVFIGDYTVASQAASAGLTAVSQPSLWLGMIFYDRDGAVSLPLQSVDVRRAINYAIDRTTLAAALFGEDALPAVELAGPTSEGYSTKAAEAYPFDQDKARELLAEAGYADGFSFDVITAGFAGFDTVAKAVQAQLAEVGITMNLTVESDGPTWVGKIVSASFPAGVQGTATYPTFLTCQQVLLPTASKVSNPFGSSADELAELCQQLAQTDADQSADLQKEINEWVVDNAWFAPVAYSSRVYFVRPEVQGVNFLESTGIANILDFAPAS